MATVGDSFAKCAASFWEAFEWREFEYRGSAVLAVLTMKPYRVASKVCGRWVGAWEVSRLSPCKEGLVPAPTAAPRGALCLHPSRRRRSGGDPHVPRAVKPRTGTQNAKR